LAPWEGEIEGENGKMNHLCGPDLCPSRVINVI